MKDGSSHKKEKMDLTRGSVLRTLFRLSIPMIFGMAGVISFNLVDTFFVSLLGIRELAAFSFTFPVVMVAGSISLGLGTGVSAYVSRAVGAGDQQQVRRLTTDSLVLALLVVGIFTLVGIFSIDPVFWLLGAPDDLMPFIRSYMVIWYSGIIFLVVPMVGNAAIRARGDTRTPSLIMIFSVLVNVVLDPIFMFGWGPIPAMTMEGAALATVVARALTLAAAIYVLGFREKMISLETPTLPKVLVSFRKILSIGLPAAGTNLVAPLSLAFVTWLASTHGSEAVASLGIATRVESFALIVVMAICSVMGPFIGQNLGAKEHVRVRSILWQGQKFVFLFGLVNFLFLSIFSHFLARLFTDNLVVADAASFYMTIVSASYCFLGLLKTGTTSLNVLGRPLQATFFTLFRLVILNIPLALLGSRLFGIEGMFVAIAVSNSCAGILSFVWIWKKLLREELFS